MDFLDRLAQEIEAVLNAGPALAAFVAAVASVIGLSIGKDHIVSGFRQKWIDELRQDIAILIARANAIQSLNQGTLSRAERAPTVFLPHSNEFNEALYRIRLRFKPQDSSAEKIYKLCDELSEAIKSADADSRAAVVHIETELVEATSVILKSEWERVKKGERFFAYTKIFACLICLAFVAALILLVVFRLKS